MTAIVLALCIGIVAGLRALTAPALVSWAVRLGWLHLEGTPLAFMGSTIAVVVFTLAALVEYVTDLLPKTPPRTAPPGLIARIVTGALSGACVGVSGGASLLTGAVLGAIGAVIGAFGGYQLRTRLVKGLNVKDIFIAIPEDLIAIALGYLFVSAR
jgi:uncharacterized membrane protein